MITSILLTAVLLFAFVNSIFRAKSIKRFENTQLLLKKADSVINKDGEQKKIG
jgi:hypothetical protein